MRTIIATVYTQSGKWYAQVPPLPMSKGDTLQHTLSELSNTLQQHFSDVVDGTAVAACCGKMYHEHATQQAVERERLAEEDRKRVDMAKAEDTNED